jgi:glycolate oxidase FAD binding subunit
MPQADPERLAQRFSSLVGEHLLQQPRGHESIIAQIVIEPERTEQIAEIVHACESDRLTLAAFGGGRSLTLMRSEPVNVGISLARMKRVIAYEPEDMTIVAEAGITIAELNRAMISRKQRLPVDPEQPGQSTLGATIATGKSGPLRLSEGTIRDLLIGITFVATGGRTVHGGGRVVKNVAGYDLMKVMTGSYGTLGIVAEAVCKVRPIPDIYALAVAAFASPSEAFSAAVRISDSISLAHCEIVKADSDGRCVLYAGFSGIALEIVDQRDKIRQAIGAAEFQEGAAAIATYERLRDWPQNPHPLAAQLVVRPVDLEHSLAQCNPADFRAHALNGVAQLYDNQTLKAEDTIARWRAIAHRGGGHLRVIAAPFAMRGQIRVFDEPPAPAMTLMRRLKSSFDPQNTFNPGCFVGGL